MKKSHKPHKSRKFQKIDFKNLPPWMQIALPSGLAAVLLALILVLGAVSGHPAPAQTEPTLPPLALSPFSPEDFVLRDGFMTTDAAEARTGVDISEFQTEIDWAQVKASGIDFAIIRIGYRGYTKGQIFPDEAFSRHLEGAKQAGLDVGVYFFSQAITPEEAAQEAAFVLEQLDGAALTMPVVFDWEYVDETARTASLDSQTLTNCTLAFCQAIEAGGYTPMVYFNQDLAQRMFLLEQLQDYPFWLAMYDMPLDFPWKIDMWQYTESGTVPGIAEPVDLNLYFP